MRLAVSRFISNYVYYGILATVKSMDFGLVSLSSLNVKYPCKASEAQIYLAGQNCVIEHVFSGAACEASCPWQSDPQVQSCNTDFCCLSWFETRVATPPLQHHPTFLVRPLHMLRNLAGTADTVPVLKGKWGRE